MNLFRDSSISFVNSCIPDTPCFFGSREMDLFRNFHFISFASSCICDTPCFSGTGKSDEHYLGYETWLPVAPKVNKPRSIYNAASLAYLGDCIYEVALETFSCL